MGVRVSFSLVFLLAQGVSAHAQSLADARKDLYAARYAAAADLFSRYIAQSPNDSEAHYGLVRALISAHRPKEAYAAAENANKIAPPTPASLSAVGFAAYRRGEIDKAEDLFRAALKINPRHPGALRGLASVYSTVSKAKTSRQLMLAAYRQAPDDPDLMLAYANSLTGKERVAALEKTLAALDSSTDVAKALRTRIENEKALGDRIPARLVSPYERTQIKMYAVLAGVRGMRGFGVHVVLNGKHTARMLLDSQSSGIALTAKAAEKAGLTPLGKETFQTKGVGDRRQPEITLAYLASEVRVGSVTFADYPVQVFDVARSPNYDGVIGPDVFRQFLMVLDFPKFELTLEPRPEGPRSKDEPIESADAPAPGFHRALRFGDQLTLSTSMNEQKAGQFLVHTGSSINVIDAGVASELNGRYRDDATRVRGIQGRVENVSRAYRVFLDFAGFRHENPDLIALDLTKMSDEMGSALSGLLGVPALAQLKMSIDYEQGTLKLEHLYGK